MPQKNNRRGVKVGLLIGGIVGGILALLLAPKKGADTRRELLMRGGQARTRAGSIARRTAGTGTVKGGGWRSRGPGTHFADRKRGEGAYG